MKKPLHTEVVLLGATHGPADLPRRASVEEISPSTGCVVVTWQPDLSGVVAALRETLPDVHLIAALGRDDESLARLGEVVPLGFDDLAIGEDHLEERLARWRQGVVQRAAVADYIDAYERIVDMLNEISAHPDLQEILRVSILRMSQLFVIHKVSVVLFKPGDEYGFVVAERDQDLDNIVIRLENYPELMEIIRTREPLVIPDITADALMSGVRDKLEEAKVKYRSSVLFPLLRKDTVVGALFLRSLHEVPAMEERVLSLGRVIASVTAIAIGGAMEQDVLESEHRALLRDKEDVAQALADHKHFADFFEQTHDGIVVTDQDGAIRYVNRSAGDILKQAPESLKMRSFVELLSPQYHRLAERALAGERVGGEHGYVDLLVPVSGAGATDEVVLSAAVRRLQQGGVLITFRDVTGLREIESELRQTKEFLENLIQSSVDAIIAADTQGIIILFNRAAEQLVGYTAREAVGRLSIADLFPADEADDMMRRLRSEAYGGRGRLELARKELVAKNGTVVPVNLTGSIIYEDDEEIASVGIFTDLRDRMRIEEKLNHVQRQLQLSERQAVAVELAGVAAHELNQPLTSILGYAELLRRRLADDDANKKPIDVICRETERMASIVKRIGQITDYKAKTYVGGSKILDLGATDQEPEGEQE